MKSIFPLLLIIIISAIALPSTAQAETISATAPLSPANMVPPVTGLNASGTAVLTLDTASTSARLEVSFSFPGSVTVVGLSVHEAPVGELGEPVITGRGVDPVKTITFAGGNGMLSMGTFSFDPRILPRLIGNPSGFYIRLSTSAAPAGAMRGQFSRWVETLSATFRRENVIPPPTGLLVLADSSMTINLTRDLDRKILRGSLSLATPYVFETIPELPVNDIVSSLRIHEGAAGLNGPALIDTGLSVADGFRSPSGFINLTVSGVNADILQRLVANPENFYLLLSTVSNPNGRVRNQFVSFSAPMVIRQMSDYLLSPAAAGSVTLEGSGIGLNSRGIINGLGGNLSSLDITTGKLTIKLPSTPPGPLPVVVNIQVENDLNRVRSNPQALVIADPAKVNPAPVTTVDAAGYGANVAPEAIVATFGMNLASRAIAASGQSLPTSIDGTTVYVNGAVAPLFFVSPTQVNYQLPPNIDPGTARVVILAKDGTASQGQINITPVAPGIFTALSNGAGAPAAVASADGINFNIRVGNPDGSPRPLDVGSFVSLFGTGIRFAPNPDLNNRNGVAESVMITLGGVNVVPLFAGAQGQLIGLDQINFQIPSTLAGRGDVDLIVVVGGRPANTVKLNIK